MLAARDVADRPRPRHCFALVVCVAASWMTAWQWRSEEIASLQQQLAFARRLASQEAAGSMSLEETTDGAHFTSAASGARGLLLDNVSAAVDTLRSLRRRSLVSRDRSSASPATQTSSSWSSISLSFHATPLHGWARPLLPRLQDWIHHYEPQVVQASQHGYLKTRRPNVPSGCASDEHRRSFLIETYDAMLQRHFASAPTLCNAQRYNCAGNTYSWPVIGDTMISPLRLDNIRDSIKAASHAGLPGHYVETGVWRGGASAYALAVMQYLNFDRHVFLCDSYEGLPTRRMTADQAYQRDDLWHTLTYFQYPLRLVDAMFRNVGLLPRLSDAPGAPRAAGAIREATPPDPRASTEVAAIAAADALPTEPPPPSFSPESLMNASRFSLIHADPVHFVKGYFVDSMKPLRSYLRDGMGGNATISILRLDGDMYESTMDVLYHLYDAVDIGGFIIVDDWAWQQDIFDAKWAVLNFRELHGIEDDDHAMVDVDGLGAFWRKQRQVDVRMALYPGRTEPLVTATTTDVEGQKQSHGGGPTMRLRTKEERVTRYESLRLRWEGLRRSGAVGLTALENGRGGRPLGRRRGGSTPARQQVRK